VETIILAGQDYDYGDFREISFSSPQTLFDFDLVLWDLRWLCYGYRFETIERYPDWAEPKRLIFRDGLKQKILSDRERRISEIEHLMDMGGALSIMVSIPIIYSFSEDALDEDNTNQVFDNYSFLPPAIEEAIRDKLVEGSGNKIEFKGNKALLPAWNKIKHASRYSAYFTSDIGDSFLYIKGTNYSVGSWFSYRKGQIFLIPHTPDDGGDDYPAFVEAARQLVNIVRTKMPRKEFYLPKVEKKKVKPLKNKLGTPQAKPSKSTKNTNKITINVHGNISGSNIIIGHDNKIEDS
jgi:hypothetical protein